MPNTFIRSARRIALAYIAVSSLWILFSDRWIAAVFREPELVSLAQTFKGAFFVLFTGVLLYALMRRTLRRLNSTAFEDPLCGLPNRLAFISELKYRCRRYSTRSRSFCLTVLDIDHFTDLNDEQGHGKGDLALKLVSQRLQDEVGPGWYVARLGGDEFGLISPPNADPEAVLAKLDSLQQTITGNSEHSLLQDRKLSAGTCRFPEHGKSSHDLLRHADMALSAAKDQGRNQHKVYREELKLNRIQQISLLKELRTACDTGAFTLVYQPQWSVAQQSWAGAEVLIRWHNPQLGNVPPDVFIPLAEREGLITTITEFVVKQALRELQAAGIDRHALKCLAINLSQPVLLHGVTMDRLAALILQQGENCPRITLEITETAAMQDLDATLMAMQRWRKQGIEFSIDDFGTGYSSLARLKEMPIAELKIDRSFIRAIPDDQNDSVITKAILAMANTLSLNVVAEGVETREQADFLTEHGCTMLQGYYLARPMPVEQLQSLLGPAEVAGPIENVR